jgi:hypothetical protein
MTDPARSAGYHVTGPVVRDPVKGRLPVAARWR